MAQFAVNTGCRDQEIRQLRWEWEVYIPELNLSVFIIPAAWVKNAEDRLVILNDNAKEVIEEVRGIDPTFVFTYQGKPLVRMLRSAWKRARIRAGLPYIRVHDLTYFWETVTRRRGGF